MNKFFLVLALTLVLSSAIKIQSPHGKKHLEVMNSANVPILVSQTVPSFFPTSVEVPSSYVIVSVNEVLSCVGNQVPMTAPQPPSYWTPVSYTNIPVSFVYTTSEITIVYDETIHYVETNGNTYESPFSMMIPVSIPASVMLNYIPSSIIANFIPSSLIQESFAVIPATQRERCSMVLAPTPITVPSFWQSPVIVPASVVSEIPSNQIVIIPSSPSVVIVDLTEVPAWVSSEVIITVPTVPQTVRVPTTWASPVVVPLTWVESLPSTLIITISSQPSAVIINYENVPSYVPSLVISPVPEANIVSVAVSSWVSAPTSPVRIPSTWVSPVVVPAQWVESVPSTLIVTIPGSPSAVIINWENVPSFVPTAVIVTVPSTVVITVPAQSWVSVPATVRVPTTWASPVVVPISWVESLPSTLIITISSQPSAVIINYENVPSFVPTIVIAPVPESNIVSVAVSSWVSAPTSPVRVPSTWVSPVVVPAQWAEDVPTTLIITIPGSPSAVIINWENVPSFVPTAVIVTVPSTDVITVPAQSWVSVPSVVAVPASWSSPVVVPYSWVSSVPAYLRITISSQPSAVIIDWTNVPQSVPTIVIASIPSSNIIISEYQTPISKLINNSPFYRAPQSVVEKCMNVMSHAPTSLIPFSTPKQITPITVYIPSTWVSPVYVPAGWVESLPSSQVVTVVQQSSFVVVDYYNVPSFVPSALIVSVPSTQIVTVAISSWISAPSVVRVPTTIQSPVAVPISWLSGVPTSLYVTVPGSPSVVVISYEFVPSYVPTVLVVSIPTTNVIQVPADSFVSAPSTVRIPSNWASPVAIPAQWAESIPSTFVITVPGSPSVVIVNWENVPTVVPTIVIATVPFTNVDYVPVSSWVSVPSVVAVPPSWSSPVVVPFTQISGVLNPSQYVTVASSPSVVIIESYNVPSWVPQTVVVSVPLSHQVQVEYVTVVYEITVDDTFFVPTTWVAPVIISAEYATQIAPSLIATISSDSSVIIVPATVLEYLPPTAAMTATAIPSFNIVSVPVSSWETPVLSWIQTETLTYVPSVLTIPSFPTYISVPISQVSIIYKTTTEYIESDGYSFTTTRTIYKPATWVPPTFVPSFVPSYVTIPSSYVVLPVSAFHCNNEFEPFLA